MFYETILEKNISIRTYSEVAIIELDLVDQVELQEVTIRDRDSELFNNNPAGKVPTLATDDGFILSETQIIVS
ncbi:glutathione S-transferase N-terminal domain-containing protein [Nostoc parmelioides]|uniref:glutathione S-transferase N-terminal domain-containing protein n=1 Tax=Nostoc parmelioides TaxID=1521621 RepID=UPI001A7EC95F|nr:glutathione S-transferase N-terminal domain-containing protein [Nostoc parmelioides]